jgi:beta-barrel assembly-enhancing protease
MKIIRLIILLLTVTLLGGCTDENGAFNVFDVQEDADLGKQFNEQILADPGQYPILDRKENRELYSDIDGSVKEILSSKAIQHRNDFNWEVFIIENDTTLNAFATPGGYVYVYTGLIKYLDSKDQLAGVLGHEIAHADLRHSTEQLTKSYGLGLIIKFFFGDNGTLANMAGSLVGLQFSREDETEADMQSVVYLYDTQYDPRGVARFFEKMEAQGETLGPLVFLSTHPNPENRVDKIMLKWKELGAKKGISDKEGYAEIKKLLP